MRLSLSGCIRWTPSRVHRLRSRILHRSIKKNHQLFLKTTKVRARKNFGRIFFWDRKNFNIFQKSSSKIGWKWKILRSKIFEIFWDRKIFNWIFNENFRKKSQKIKKSQISKNLKNFRKVSLTFFVFKKNRLFFFIDRCKSLLRSDCAYLELIRQRRRNRWIYSFFLNTLCTESHELQNQTHIDTFFSDSHSGYFFCRKM